MDNINLPSSLILVWDLRRALETRQSLHIGIKSFIHRELSTPFSKEFRLWWQRYPRSDSGYDEKTQWIDSKMSNPHHRVLYYLIHKGLQGISIYENLADLEQQMINSCDEDIEKHISLMPLILQIPLLGLLFPAILMLILLPVLRFLQF